MLNQSLRFSIKLEYHDYYNIFLTIVKLNLNPHVYNSTLISSVQSHI